MMKESWRNFILKCGSGSLVLWALVKTPRMTRIGEGHVYIAAQSISHASSTSAPWLWILHLGGGGGCWECHHITVEGRLGNGWCKQKIIMQDHVLVSAPGVRRGMRTSCMGDVVSYSLKRRSCFRCHLFAKDTTFRRFQLPFSSVPRVQEAPCD